MADGGPRRATADVSLTLRRGSATAPEKAVPFKPTDSRADKSGMSGRAALLEYKPVTHEQELVTVRVGSDTRLHAMTRDGAGMCPVVNVLRTFGSNTAIVKVADGIDAVDCNTCVWGFEYFAAFAFPDGKLL